MLYTTLLRLITLAGKNLIVFICIFLFLQVKLLPALMKLLINFFLLLFLSIAANTTAAQKKWTVENVPNPKAHASWNTVSDPDDILQDETEDEINSLFKQLEQKTTDQAGVVVLQSIGKKNPREFATALFRRWGIGSKDKNNGLLILLVMDQRRMEFEVGYGLEGKLTDLVCKQIQEEYMVPYARQGNFDEAVLSGVQQVYQVLMGETVQTEEANPDPGHIPMPYANPDYAQRNPAPSPKQSFSDKVFDYLTKKTGFGGILFIFLYLYI